MSAQHHEGAKLPPGWVVCESTTHRRPYFFNTQTGKSAWFPPEETSYLQKDVQQQENNLDPSPAEQPSSSPPHKRSRRELPPLPRPPLTQEERFEGGNAALIPASEDPEGGVKVAVIVPYRDLDPLQKRSAHLERFIPYMEDFLGRHCREAAAEFHVYVVEQSTDDGRKFNRGKLLNIGFDLARKEGCGAFLFHDVDLLPSDELGRWYASRPEGPVHVARVWKQYSNNPKYFGGVVAFSREDFEEINGFPNTFWGWGGEDDEMYSRIVEAKLKPQKAEEGGFTDLEGLDLPSKLDLLRQNEQWKCQVKKEALEEHAKTWRKNGLADLKYKVLDRVPLAAGSEKVTVDVEFNGHWTDTITHWRDLHKRGKDN